MYECMYECMYVYHEDQLCRFKEFKLNNNIAFLEFEIFNYIDIDSVQFK